MRDDFKSSTKRILAERVGFFCSNPDCRKPTVGPARGDCEKSVNTGIAAHITAASPGGPRYDPALSSDERCDISNGIWLCSNCARLVDSDIEHYTVKLLRRWKPEAEKKAFEALAAGEAELPPTDPLDSHFGELVSRLQDAAGADVERFKTLNTWPLHAVTLDMRMEDNSGGMRIDVHGCAAAINASRELRIVASPGTGKTTTLVQLAEAILKLDGRIPVLVPLGEWSTQGMGIFESLCHRVAFSDFDQQHFGLLARKGLLVLLLDGWNELDTDSERRAVAQLRQLRRDYELLQIAVSTRRQALDVPVLGPTLKIEPLSKDKQIEIAHGVSGIDGETLLERARRTPGIRELVSVPLYLNVLLAASSEEAFVAETKDEIFRLSVDRHEKRPENAQILRYDLYGTHKDMLVALAVGCVSRAATAIPEHSARTIVSGAGRRLQEEGQLTQSPQPAVILDVLVSHHILVRAGSQGGVSFQHHQFQEWYASFHVEKLMRKAAAGDEESAKKLKMEILNMPEWEEAVFFACERLSRDGSLGAEAAAVAVLLALSVDPMLAAEMIRRSSPAVWEMVRDEAVDFADRWYGEGTVDRAVRFMIITGKKEFARYLWPLIENADYRACLRVRNTAGRFRPSVLGDGALDRFSRIPYQNRRILAIEIAMEGDLDGIEFAANLAKTDPDPEFKASVIQALYFRQADRLVREVLRTAGSEMWSMLALRGYMREIPDPEIAKRLRREERNLIQSESNHLDRLALLLRPGLEDRTLETEIEAVIVSPGFPAVHEQSAGIVAQASRLYPQATAQALVRRLEERLELPYRNIELLAGMIPVDEGPISQLVTDPSSSSRVAKQAMKVVGPKIVGTLLDRYLILDEKRGDNEPWSAEMREIHSRIVQARPEILVKACFDRSGTDRPETISAMSYLIACANTETYGECPLKSDEDLARDLVDVFRRWTNALCSSSESKRMDLMHLAMAIGWLLKPELTESLQRLFKKETEMWELKYKQWEEARNQGGATSIPSILTSIYAQAFIAIGDERIIRLMEEYLSHPDFGRDAATVLKGLHDKKHGLSEKNYLSDLFGFSQIDARRLQKDEGSMQSSPFGEPIFAVIEQLTRAESSIAEKRHALELAEIAFSMPYANKAGLVETLLNLPLPIASKRGLCTALVLAGEKISSRLVLEGIRDFLNSATEDPWMFDEQKWKLYEWLALLPFTDRPLATLDALKIIPAQHQKCWDLGKLLSALGHSPGADAEDVLSEMARRDPAFMEEYHWQRAMLCRGTHSCLRALELSCDAEGSAKVAISHQLAELAKKNSDLRTELVRRYEDESYRFCHSMIEKILVENPDTRVVLAMVRSYALRKKKFDGLLGNAIRGVALKEFKVSYRRSVFEIHSSAVPDLRRQLFGMLGGDSERTGLAEVCLTMIDRLRDEYGVAKSEPRHPDIESGRPWPLVAGKNPNTMT